jgi:hypothetical protein
VTPEKNTEGSGVRKLQRRHKSLIRGKRSRHLRRQEENLEEMGLLHQRHNQK